MIDENASSNSLDELIQANIPLRRERIIDIKMEERKNENFEPLENPIPFPVPLEMEYKPKDPFLQDLKEPIVNVGVKLIMPWLFHLMGIRVNFELLNHAHWN
jgi:hypothetical protein